MAECLDLDLESYITDDEITGKEPPKKKAKVYKQKYNSAWERNPQFKGWLKKTQKRNSLKTSTMDALLIVKQHLPCSCVEYNADTSLCKCINVDMYDSQSSDDD